jgi:hypothetical protein
MIDLRDYLENHKKQIVDSVEGRWPRNVFEEIINYLMNMLPIGHDGQRSRDKTHEGLAIAIIYSMCCGWLSQAKGNRGV